MKSLRFWKMTALAVAAVMMVACSSSRNLEKSKDEAAMEAVAAAQLADSLQREAYLQKVNDNAQHARFITSKVKFSVEVGNRQMNAISLCQEQGSQCLVDCRAIQVERVAGWNNERGNPFVDPHLLRFSHQTRQGCFRAGR